MEKYKVYTTPTFDKEIVKLSEEEQRRIQNIFFQIRDNPYVGDQLRYRHLREKRLDEKRIYYLVYEDLNAVLITSISGKKDQKKTINHIISYFDEYRLYIEKLIKN